MSFSPRSAVLAFLRHLSLAALMTLLVLLAIERLMPGSVLPFMDIVDWLLPVAGFALVMTGLKDTGGILARILQIVLVCCLALGLLALWATRLADLGLVNVSVLVAAVLALVGWVMAVGKPQA